MHLKPPGVWDFPTREAELVAVVAVVAASVLLLAAARAAQRPRGQRAVLSAMLAAVAFMGFLEIVLRIHAHLRPEIGYRMLPDLTWTLSPNLRNVSMDNAWGTTTLVSTNSLGLRDGEVPSQKSPAEFRILCIGDSWTFGQGVPAQKTFCKRLESLLQERHPDRRIAVINAGVPGFSYFQGYFLLKQLLPYYRPDLVMLCGFNEHGNEQIPEMEEALPAGSLERGAMGALQTSMVYLMLRKQVYRWMPPASAASPKPAEDGARMLSEDAALGYVGAMIALVRQAGLPCVVFHHGFEIINNADALPLFQRPSIDRVLSRVPPAEDVVVVDLHPVDSEMTQAYFMQTDDPVHPSARGHDSMAGALMLLLEKEGLLSR